MYLGYAALLNPAANCLLMPELSFIEAARVLLHLRVNKRGETRDSAMKYGP